MTPTRAALRFHCAASRTAAENPRFDPAFGGMLPGAEPQRRPYPDFRTERETP